jgi:hypothetical protein
MIRVRTDGNASALLPRHLRFLALCGRLRLRGAARTPASRDREDGLRAGRVKALPQTFSDLAVVAKHRAHVGQLVGQRYANDLLGRSERYPADC